MQVHSVVFANSGTLLLCLVDTTGQLAGLRQKIREAFPGEKPEGCLQLFARVAGCEIAVCLKQDCLTSSAVLEVLCLLLKLGCAYHRDWKPGTYLNQGGAAVLCSSVVL
jgi:hypothetical protein